MIMPLTAYEKKMIEERKDQLIDTFLSVEMGDLLCKLLINSLRNAEVIAGQWDESVFQNKTHLRKLYYILLEHAANEASKERKVAEYTTGMMAKFLGVSITTINNWIAEGRFEGVVRSESRKQVRIPANVFFTSPSGNRYRVSELVEMWEKENSTQEEPTDELMFLTRQIALYEGKYRGELEKTLGLKKPEEMTAEEETDASAWKYFLQRQHEIFTNKNS